MASSPTPIAAPLCLTNSLIASNNDALIPSQLRARDALRYDRLLEVIAMILALYPRTTKADTRARAELLTPILEQADAIRQRSRRNPQNINPTTGQRLDAETPPLTADETDVTPL